MSEHSDDLGRRLDDLGRRHAAELRLVETAGSGGGIAGLVRSTAEMSGNSLWLLDPQHRVVARSATGRGGELSTPDLVALLGELGPVDPSGGVPRVVEARPAVDLARRHLVTPVSRDDTLFAWLVMAEIPGRFTAFDHVLAARAAFHLASEYVVQRRVARVSWNAKATLARQMVRGSVREEDLRLTAEYLGVEAAASRVIVYLADAPHEVELRDEESIAERVAHALRVEVLGTRGSEGTILLVEAPAEIGSAMMVARVKHAMAQVLAEFGELGTIVGVSGVARPDALTRAYREAREVALCVDRFAHGGTPVISVDDLGPARLFIANGDPASVRRYVRDVLGPLLTGAPGTPDLLRTVQSFFDTGRSVRASAALLGIHENTVRLRLAKVHDLTGLDVAADPTDQLSVQTALLVLRLEGHSALPAFEDTHTDEQQETA